MDITSFRTFLAAADTGSFAAAAQRVNASPSSVTERIKQLEHRLGVRLFDRDKRGCRLTAAGRKFVDPASQAVRAWEIAQHVVSLPNDFTSSLAIGGQYALWGALLTEWLAQARSDFPKTAFRASAGASARLHRDLRDGFLDMAVAYDPVFHRDIHSEKLFDDRLALVSGTGNENWREQYVRIEWGQAIGVEISAKLKITPAAGLVLDLGRQSAEWLIQQKMAGFMPQKLVQSFLDSGALHIVEDIPYFDYPAFVSWRNDVDPQLARDIVGSLALSVAHL
ncbi:LysR family transcriptional regulator [Parasphingorhabdus halotolerans]|uniref:LysR family transcriptional regulator n=1 Tax=Parasphingorhabdus halotolerans TaxID=2725558 RepID=A0A6H2DKP1_9SPHN|nr:LysR family transcriptional regulator [Parasphingorhabdus halotolerans]QJB68914.1 LysR family transcriptional regulator [Parasphingorhabdus halotolerans]